MKRNIIFIALIAIFVATTASKCNKETPPKATVTVVDEQGHPLAGVSVKVYSDPSLYNNTYPSVGYYNPDESKLYDIKISDANGQTHHEFKYESIYSVKATYIKSIAHAGTHNADTTFWYGYGALILKNNETYEERVIVRPNS
jgi:hypothetical protein